MPLDKSRVREQHHRGHLRRISNPKGRGQPAEQPEAEELQNRGAEIDTSVLQAKLLQSQELLLAQSSKEMERSEKALKKLQAKLDKMEGKTPEGASSSPGQDPIYQLMQGLQMALGGAAPSTDNAPHGAPTARSMAQSPPVPNGMAKPPPVEHEHNDPWIWRPMPD